METLESGSIEVSFLGGASSIGASCALVRVAGKAFVVDCGVRYSGPSPLPDLSRLSEVSVDAVLVTHAHMDHSGGLPVLAEACPGAPVFATPPTIDLVGILLRDSVRLMNAPDREGDVPLYTQQQVDQLLHMMIPVKYHQPIQVGESEIRWLPASHILGASMILMKTPAGTVLFTGDYSVSAQQTVPALGRPDFQADLVISESTYGQRLHEDRNAAEERLLGQVAEVVERGGRVLIPAFAVGRAQEVLLILKRALRGGKLPETPVFVDGMVRAVCDVYRKHEPFVSRSLAHEIRHTPHAFYTDMISPVTNPQERRRVLESSPGVIVASSGMLSGGPSAGYCEQLARNANDAVLLTGYQDEESPGRALLDLARSEGPKEMRLGQATVPVACHFGSYGLSAHADRMQMVAWIEATSPRTVVLVHGDQDAQESLARSLQCPDVLCAKNGLSITRTYTPRRAGDRRPAARVPSADELDIERARNLLGPAGQTPLRAAAIAEAWFGKVVDRATVEQFARRLEAAGLVRRDDHRRDRLWVLGVQESKLFAEEAEVEQRLKQVNPKGRLLEFCMRMRIDPPESEISVSGAFHEARMTLSMHGELCDSGSFRAASKKTAEQLAAESLLDIVSRVDEQHDVERIDEENAMRLQSLNPKGKLLEWCAKRRMPPPHFEQSVTPGGFRVRVALQGEDADGQLVTAWFQAAKVKVAEHAAAEQILSQVAECSATEEPPIREVAQAKTVPAAAEPTQGRNAAMALNELVQVGLLQATGYELLEQSGPSHQPKFVTVAWASLPDGQTLRGEPAEAASKKAAQRAAADRLFNLLVEQGITR